jgi:hypothetical protein
MLMRNDQLPEVRSYPEGPFIYWELGPNISGTIEADIVVCGIS